MRVLILTGAVGLLLAVIQSPAPTSPAARAVPPQPEKFDDTGFVPIFDGKTLTGWKISAKTGHSRTSKNTSGGKWVVEKGAIVGSQDVAWHRRHTHHRSDLWRFRGRFRDE
jgi:hypothetical protein